MSRFQRFSFAIVSLFVVSSSAGAAHADPIDTHAYKGPAMKWVKNDGLPENGEHLEPRIVRERLAHPDPQNKTRMLEEVMEEARRLYAPHMPSRADSVYAASPADAVAWKARLQQVGVMGDRTLMRLKPADPARVVMVDNLHFSRADSALIAMKQAQARHEPRAKIEALMQEARAAAKDYWTQPVHENSRSEILLGGGAIVKNRVSEDAQQRILARAARAARPVAAPAQRR
jgi:hypothetical protein